MRIYKWLCDTHKTVGDEDEGCAGCFIDKYNLMLDNDSKAYEILKQQEDDYCQTLSS